MQEFNFESTTGNVFDGVDLNGKVALVTVASAGLGVETSAPASAGATVVMLGRDQDMLAAAVASSGEAAGIANLSSAGPTW